jgi:ribonuclease HI
MKLAFGIISKPADLWVKVLRGKYCEVRDEIVIVKWKGTLSHTWRSITSVWEQMLAGTKWNIHNGRRCKFRSDRWLEGGVVLMDIVDPVMWEDQRDATFNEYVNEEGQWEWDKLELLPMHIRMQIAAIKPPDKEGEDDKVGWGLSPNGKFSTSSAYSNLQNHVEVQEQVWDRVWQWKGPERIKTFTWLCANDALMTNERRRRMKLCDSNLFTRCGAHAETTIHAIRDCFHARIIWEQVIPPSKWSLFFSATLTELFEKGCRDEYQIANGPVTFGVTVWLCWKRRNIALFQGEDALIEGPIHTIRTIVQQTAVAGKVNGMANRGDSRFDVNERQASHPGWYKLNSDGASNQTTRRAAAGGLIRDDNGLWVREFGRSLGYCSAYWAEVWALKEGLQLAWNLSIKQLIVETDSAIMHRVVGGDNGTTRHELDPPLIKQIRELLCQDWLVQITLISRNYNYCADLLAKNALGKELGLHILIDIPSEL